MSLSKKATPWLLDFLWTKNKIEWPIMLTFNPDAAESLVALTDALYKNKNEWRTLLAFNPDAAESLVALTDALCKNRISVFYTWQRPNIKELLPRKILISLDSAFSWLFLLVCFDTKPLFLKVKKVKKRCSAGHRNLLLHTSSFKKPKQFGFYISKDIWGLFYFTRLPFISTVFKVKIFCKQM